MTVLHDVITSAKNKERISEVTAMNPSITGEINLELHKRGRQKSNPVSEV
jgi:hypothetical protein